MKIGPCLELSRSVLKMQQVTGSLEFESGSSWVLRRAAGSGSLEFLEESWFQFQFQKIQIWGPVLGFGSWKNFNSGFGLVLVLKIRPGLVSL